MMSYKCKNGLQSINYKPFKIRTEVRGGFEPPYAVLQTGA